MKTKIKRPKPRRVLTEQHKARLRESALNSWKSGKRRKRRTKNEIAADQKIFIDQDYRKAADAQYERVRQVNAARREAEDVRVRMQNKAEVQRLEDEAWNAREQARLEALGYRFPRLPKGVRSIGHGRMNFSVWFFRRPSVQIMP